MCEVHGSMAKTVKLFCSGDWDPKRVPNGTEYLEPLLDTAPTHKPRAPQRGFTGEQAVNRTIISASVVWASIGQVYLVIQGTHPNFSLCVCRSSVLYLHIRNYWNAESCHCRTQQVNNRHFTILHNPLNDCLFLPGSLKDEWDT